LSPLNKRLIRERSHKYGFLKSYLDTQGYSVYPTEIWCGSRDVPYEQNLGVDVAAFKHGYYYAFEYKSNADQLLRALKQVANYSLSFDYVVVVAEIPRYDISVNPARGVRIKDILKTGAGLWTVQFPNRMWPEGSKPVFAELMAPSLQHPNSENKRWIEQKFKRYVWGLPCPEDPHQKLIEQWLH